MGTSLKKGGGNVEHLVYYNNFVFLGQRMCAEIMYGFRLAQKLYDHNFYEFWSLNTTARSRNLNID